MTLGVTGAEASEGSDLMAQVDRGAKEIQGMMLQIRDLGHANGKDVRVRDLMFESFQKGKAELDAKDAAARGRQKAEHDRANAIVERWNHKCAEMYVGKLSEGAYSACSLEQGQMDPLIQRIRTNADHDFQQYNDNDRKPLVARLQRQADGVSEIETRLKLRYDNAQELQRRIGNVAASLEKAHARLETSCREAPSEELPAYCGQIGWDGARRGLPPLTDILGHLINLPPDDDPSPPPRVR